MVRRVFQSLLLFYINKKFCSWYLKLGGTRKHIQVLDTLKEVAVLLPSKYLNFVLYTYNAYTLQDVAKYVLYKTGPIPTLKLHIMLYYIQAYYLAEHNYPLFESDFYKHSNGPVCKDLYKYVSDPWYSNTEVQHVRNPELYSFLDKYINACNIDLKLLMTIAKSELWQYTEDNTIISQERMMRYYARRV